jgi:hypothetical protein
MKIECTAEIKESTSNQDWYYVRLAIGRMYFDSPLLRLSIAERAIDELRKADSQSQTEDDQMSPA